MGDNSIVYDFYSLAAKWTTHAKNLQSTDLTVLKESLVIHILSVAKPVTETNVWLLFVKKKKIGFKQYPFRILRPWRVIEEY